MKEVKIYLNKISKLTILIYAILGGIYLIIGISSILNERIINGIIHISISIAASILLIVSILPKYSKMLYFAIDNKKISIRKLLFLKRKEYYWKDISTISIKNKKVILNFENKKKTKIRLNDLDYNEQIEFIEGIEFFIKKHKIILQ